MEAFVGRETELERLRRILVADGPHTVLVVGGSGVGKSRILHEVASSVEDREWLVLRVYGSRPLRSIPLGAVSHLVKQVPRDDPSLLFHASINRIRREALQRRILLLVDDCQDLDDGSAGFVHQLVSHGTARAILTKRSDSTASETILSLGSIAPSERLELNPLDLASQGALTEAALGGPIEPRLLDELRRIALGNPLYMLTCIRAARDTGSIQLRDGTWHLAGHLVSSRLNELVLSRTRDLSADERRALALVAVGGSLPEAAIQRVVHPHALGGLADRGLVVVNTGLDVPTVEVAHPVYGETIATSLTPDQRRAILIELANAVLAEEETVSMASLRAAVWLLEAEQPIAHDHGVDAAREAMLRLDYGLAQRLARSALRARPGSVPAGLLLGQAMAFQGQGEQALDLLGTLEPSNEAESAEIALAQGHALAFALGRPDEAASLLTETATHVRGALRARLDADTALYRATVGNFRAVFDAANSVLDNPDASDIARLTSYLNYLLARSMTARLDGFDEMMDRALSLALRHTLELPLAVHQLGLVQVGAWAAAGRSVEAQRYARERVAEADADGTPNALWLAWLGYVCGLRGKLDQAIEAQSRALSLYRIADPFRLWPQSVGLLAMHQAQAARLPEDVSDSLHEAERIAGGETRLTVWLGRARAWVEASMGHIKVAAEIASEVGIAAIRHDHVAWGVAALHDAVRFGEPTGVRDAIEETVRATSGAHLLEAMASHASALDEADTSALEVAADALARCGSPLLAAEAWAQISKVHAERTESQLLERASLLSQLWHRRCPTAVTPALTDRPGGFTPRQLQVVEGAGIGLTSREIAERLYLSHRTVDNHLHSIYRRLGVAGRDELAALTAEALSGVAE